LTATVLTAELAVPDALDARIARYAALGDSFTAAQGAGAGRWTDRLVGRLARTSPDLAYRNLAEPGATSARVLEQQLPTALEFRPDLVTVVCGINDVLLSPQPDVGRYAAHLKEIICLLRERTPGVLVVTATCPNHASRLPVTERVRERLENAIELLNEVTRSLAGRLDVPYVDFGGQHLPASAASRQPAAWCPLRRTDSASVAEAFTQLVEAAGGPARTGELRAGDSAM
jgi:lysophospholipase L1-like esterase